MGMSASQGRLLQLTDRKNQVGLQLINLSSKKRSLALEQQKLSKEYNEALSSVVAKWSSNAGATYTELSYANLMYPSSITTNSPTLVSDARGRIVLDDKYNTVITNALGENDKFDINFYNAHRSELLSAMTGIDAENITNYDNYSKDFEYLKEAYSAILNSEPKEKFDTGSISDFLTKTSVGTETNVETYSPSRKGYKTSGNTWLECYKNEETVVLGDGTTSGTGINDSAYTILLRNNKDDETGESTNGFYYLMKDYIPDDSLDRFEEACIQVAKSIPLSVSVAETTDSDGNKTSVSSLVDVNMYIDYDDNKVMKLNVREAINQIMELYTGSSTGTFQYRNKDDENSNYYKNSLSIDASKIYGFSTQNVKDVFDSNGFTNGKYTLTNKGFDEVHNKWEELLNAFKAKMTDVTSEKSGIISGSEKSQIDFYDAVFSTIAENGYVYNFRANDSEYLNGMLQNSLYTLTTVTPERDYDVDNGTVTWNNNYEFNIATNCPNVYYVKDTEKINQAEAEYEYEKSIVNSKEAVIDTRMKDLETEQSAISQMIQGIEQQRNENAERTFSTMG